MAIVLIFAGTLMVAVLISEWTARSVLSVSVLFLLAGFLFEQDLLGFLKVDPTDPLVGNLAELATFGVLFTDGMRTAFDKLRHAWRLPGRALLLGLPLTLALFAVAARVIIGMPWHDALLVGAILSPTDPVFAAAIVGRECVPAALRNLLNVESGLNDGLALPAVIVLLEFFTPGGPHYLQIAGEVAGGVVVGVVIPYAILKLEDSRLFRSYPQRNPLNAFAIGLLVLTAAQATGMNEFLAAFSAGVTVATVGRATRDSFHEFGELITELLKLAALLLFGALLSPDFLSTTPARTYLFAAVALLAVRPAALGLSLLGSRLAWSQRLVAMWFGPRGFASVVYALMMFRYGVPFGRREPILHAVGLVVALSIIAHSSTDALIARWIQEEGGEPQSPADEETEPDESLPEEERVHATERRQPGG